MACGPFQYQKNVYKCETGKPEHNTVTVDRDAGITPFMIYCPKCLEQKAHSMAHSSMYRVDQSIVPTHEWHMPGKFKPGSMSYEHFSRNGLMLREIKEAPQVKQRT